MHIGILIFDEVEVLDACGPFEVFSVAARLQGKDRDPEAIKVTLVSAYPERAVVVARGGLKLTADTTIADAPPFSLLLVPGGVTAEVERDPRVIEWIAERSSTPIVASVCTGAFLLAEAGILTNQTVTTHWEDQAELAARYPGLTVVGGLRWVQQGRIFTSAGISAGIDLALHLTGLADPGLPTRVARQMDYAWQAEGE
ncbi:DJ-1/PfpI family protein [Rarobacter faecitabidus]|uniref:DJ-1/PfpI family protein n=1 Tax=Rarobacter faecitabidus TaxID=13243 RepID=A0A542ZTE1_RARFA|nr:DJ-1/PfpI family protein [Rarobacter faecitabidus]TQL63625.1 DJ-1/PfpI family protein [Rarobacter faecitabidus]